MGFVIGLSGNFGSGNNHLKVIDRCLSDHGTS